MKISKSSQNILNEFDVFKKEMIHTLTVIDENGMDIITETDEINRMRNILKLSKKHFDVNEITEVNYNPAIAGGAKAFIDRKVITRKMAEKISKETGCLKEALLYSGIPNNKKREMFAAKNIYKKRKEDIKEHKEDFECQLKVKHTLLKKAVEKTNFFKEKRSLRKKRKRKSAYLYFTPENKFKIDPFDFEVFNYKFHDLIVEGLSDDEQNLKKPIPLNFDETLF
uniref:Uncharacterized protein n=1 Tax=Panagrolaimus sp. PS1159 TaxID=55785 RepID=A0AC35G4Y5_9BILA